MMEIKPPKPPMLVIKLMFTTPRRGGMMIDLMEELKFSFHNKNKYKEPFRDANHYH
jgi:hypothetical protein